MPEQFNRNRILASDSGWAFNARIAYTGRAGFVFKGL